RSLRPRGALSHFFVGRARWFRHWQDPRPPRPAEGVLSATVLAPEASDADALATAAYVRGPECLPELARRGSDISAVLVVPGTAGGIRILTANIDPGEFLVTTAIPGVTVLEST
ncbi:MAG: FAD:protein FMN transferase, partial [Planctomycetaceae bacterium]